MIMAAPVASRGARGVIQADVVFSAWFERRPLRLAPETGETGGA